MLLWRVVDLIAGSFRTSLFIEWGDAEDLEKRSDWFILYNLVATHLICLSVMLFCVPACEQQCHDVIFGGSMVFCPKILGGGGDLWKVLCHSMNAGSVVVISWGGGDTQNLMQKNSFERFTFTGTGNTKTLGASARTIAHIKATWWNFH